MIIFFMFERIWIMMKLQTQDCKWNAWIYNYVYPKLYYIGRRLQNYI